jgi:peptidoglycan/LPS O-acetylase OafA/YrhL
MSYTLYVTHFPILILLSGWLMSRSVQGELPPHLGWVIAGVPLTLILGYAIHRVAERPFLPRRVQA